jgi:hypothetical protein
VAEILEVNYVLTFIDRSNEELLTNINNKLLLIVTLLFHCFLTVQSPHPAARWLQILTK